jgi:hypothetical protein
MKCETCNRRPSYYFKINNKLYCYFCIPSYDDYEIIEDADAYLQLEETDEDDDDEEIELEPDLDTDVSNLYKKLNFYDACIYNKIELLKKYIPENKDNLLMGLRLALKYENVKIANFLVKFFYFQDLETIREFVPNTRLMQTWLLNISVV